MITVKTIPTACGDEKIRCVTREDKRVLPVSVGYDLTNKEVRMTIRLRYDQPILLEKVAVITVIPTGIGTITITKNNSPIDDYANLPAGLYIYDIQVKNIPDDGERDTIERGQIKILDHVTQS